MCGIAGYSWSSPHSYGLASLKEAQLLLNHRGPDSCGVFQDPKLRIGLAHTRLSVLDLTPAGHQPMLSDDSSVAIVYNGEIYNFRELRSELELAGHRFLGSSDTEVILRLYIESRKDQDLAPLLGKLNGIFTFAIWDSSCNSLWVARDANGVKPLYYSQTSETFAFASELKALSPFVEFDQSPDFVALDRYISFLWSPGERTPARNIRKLGPGQLLLVRDGRILTHSTWYNKSTSSSQNPRRLPTLSSTIHSLDRSLRTAVHRQLVADVPVGAFLSGGLDSSSVVAFARESCPDLQCFTIDVRQGGPDGFADDLPYARYVARHLGVPLHVLQVNASQMAADLEAMVWYLDEPLADPAPLNVLNICRLAREQGIKVLLSGAGGDDLFTGYRRHLALQNEKWWDWLPHSLRLQLRNLSGQLPSNQRFTRRLRRAFSGAHLEGDARLVHYFSWIERADLQALYSPAFKSALGQARAEDPMLAFLASLPRDTPVMDKMLALEQRFFLPDHNLTYTDKMSMAVGVEVRVPFLDADLVEFAAQIPSHFKQRGRQGKWILKKAMESYLPKHVVYRPKSGFGAPLRRWFQVELRDWLYDTLSVDRLQRRGLFEPQAVQRLIAANSEGRIDASYTLLSLACIEIWCQYFLDGLPSPSLNSSVADS